MPADDNTTVLPPTVEDRTTDHADDVEAISRIVADIETGFNTTDPGR